MPLKPTALAALATLLILAVALLGLTGLATHLPADTAVPLTVLLVSIEIRKWTWVMAGCAMVVCATGMKRGHTKWVLWSLVVMWAFQTLRFTLAGTVPPSGPVQSHLVLLGSAWLMFDLPVARWKPWSGVVLAMASLVATVLSMGTVPGPMGSTVIATVMQGLLVGLFAHSVVSTNRTPKPAALTDHK